MSPWHWAIVIVIFALLFGAKRLPDAARSLGRSARILKAELSADSDPGTATKTPAPATDAVVTSEPAPEAAPVTTPVTAPPSAGVAPQVPAPPTQA